MNETKKKIKTHKTQTLVKKMADTSSSPSCAFLELVMQQSLHYLEKCAEKTDKQSGADLVKTRSEAERHAFVNIGLIAASLYYDICPPSSSSSASASPLFSKIKS